MNYALMSSGLMALLLFALSFMVSMTRAREKRLYGSEEDPGSWLTKIVRAQGNATEYIPILLILMLLLEMEGTANWADYVYLAACASRYFHAGGMLLSKSLNEPHPLRFIGSLGTYICGFVLTALLIQAAL